MSMTWKGLGVLAVALVVATPLALAAEAAETAVPTFTKDVAPIIQAKCEACHRSGSIAPMSLVTYEEARPWARSRAPGPTARDGSLTHDDRV